MMTFDVTRKASSAAALLLLAACTANVEQSFLLPDKAEPVAKVVAPLPGYRKEERLVALPGLGKVHVARLTKPRNRTTIIYAGGNGSFVATAGNKINRLAALTNADIVTFDYPGRGGTTIPQTTDAMIASGPALMAALRGLGWTGTGPLYSYGFSLGGAAASNMARTGGFSGLILESTAADIAAVARGRIPSVLRPFVRVKVADDLKRFDYAGYALAARVPILMLAGAKDRSIALETSRRFADDLKRRGATVTFVEVPGGHGAALAATPARDAVRRFMADTSR